MKPEHFLVTAVPIGGGEQVTGFITFGYNPFKITESWRGTTPFCGYCRQALDWENADK